MKKPTKPPPTNKTLSREDLLHYLKTSDPKELADLYRFADGVRKEYMGDDIHIRGLMNISSYCSRECLYCGLRNSNPATIRYRMEEGDILAAVEQACETGYKTILMQSGEDEFYTEEKVASIVRAIYKRFDAAIGLSFGERPAPVLRRWFDEGACRYLIKHETSDPELYAKLHPGMDYGKRQAVLVTLKEIGYQVGSGIMIGLPGQTYESVADDIVLFRDLDIDMIGCGPYIHNPETPLKHTTPDRERFIQPLDEYVLRVTALNRIVTKDTMIPATTALNVLSPETGARDALSAGANVVMFDITPTAVKKHYTIYPKTAFSDGIADYTILKKNLEAKARRPAGTGYGHREKKR
ncbi:MAG: [FeFe] hydrogenase H-cluster radical SAM maturase HydE [bacterium]|nr:[FeFe] hydrogenase H-cluster radical SAM maturase HydE [bacterium]